MILASLKSLAIREGLLENPDYQPRAVRWGIHVGSTGEFLGLIDTLSGGGPRKKPQAMSMMIPRREGRTVKPVADFLVDKSEYVLGVRPDPEGADDALAIKHGLFLARISSAAEAVAVECLLAVKRFLENKGAIERCILDLSSREYASNDLLAFLHAGNWVHHNPDVQSYFSSIRNTSDVRETVCAVCGQKKTPVDKHPQIQLPGGSSSGIALVSFNAAAFESYGWTRNANVPVCRHCADAYTSALTRNIKDGYLRSAGEKLRKQSVRLNDNTVAVYWADAESEIVDVFASLFNEATPEAVKDILVSVYQGRSPANLDARLYCLFLSGGTGRATVRGYHTGSLATVERNVRAWFRLATLKDRPVPLMMLLRSVAVRQKDENLPPALVTEVFLSILFGRALPRWVLNAALLRSRAEQGVTKERAVLLAAYLSRARDNERKEIGMSLDPTNRSTAYLLGRLLAMLERLQREAQGGRASSVNRYFAAASTRPATVFPSMTRLAQHHLRKLKPGLGHHLNREIGELMAGISEFPASLASAQQGEFALGYYHQRVSRPAPKPEGSEIQEEKSHE